MAEPPRTPSSAGVAHDDDAAEVAGTQTVSADGSGTRDRRAPGVLRDARVAWAVAVLALAVAAAFAVQWRSLAAEADARVQAREAAEVMAAQITTFEGAEIDTFVEDLRELATGAYADQVSELFNPDFRDALRENEVESVGEVVRSFVQELDGDEAEVFVLVRQTSINAVLDEPVTDELRMELTLAREDGRWLISDVAVLGPAPPALAPPAAEGSDGGSGEPPGDEPAEGGAP